MEKFIFLLGPFECHCCKTDLYCLLSKQHVKAKLHITNSLPLPRVVLIHTQVNCWTLAAFFLAPPTPSLLRVFSWCFFFSHFLRQNKGVMWRIGAVIPFFFIYIFFCDNRKHQPWGGVQDRLPADGVCGCLPAHPGQQRHVPVQPCHRRYPRWKA